MQVTTCISAVNLTLVAEFLVTQYQEVLQTHKTWQSHKEHNATNSHNNGERMWRERESEKEEKGKRNTYIFNIKN